MVTNLSVIVHVMYTVYVHAIKLHSSPHPCIQQVSPKAKGESKLCILTMIQVDHVLAGIFYLRLLALENEIAGITQANFATIGYKPCCSMWPMDDQILYLVQVQTLGSRRNMWRSNPRPSTMCLLWNVCLTN